MTTSAPSDEHTESVGSSGSPHDRRPAWGQKARQPSPFSERLARVYWMAVILGILAEFISAFGIIVHLPLAYAIALSVFTLGQIAFVLSALATYRTHYDAANKCCISQAAAIRKLEKENIDLLYVVKCGEAAAGLTSERQESAAVVHEFPKGA